MFQRFLDDPSRERYCAPSWDNLDSGDNGIVGGDSCSYD